MTNSWMFFTKGFRMCNLEFVQFIFDSFAHLTHISVTLILFYFFVLLQHLSISHLNDITYMHTCVTSLTGETLVPPTSVRIK